MYAQAPFEQENAMERHTLGQRWMRLRNFQSRDFWAMLFARPLTILLLLPICDSPWVTPNKITTLSILIKLSGVGLIAAGNSWWANLAAALLVNFGLVLDNMDGTLARYRKCGTYFGFYFDKATDATTLALMFWAMAYKAFMASGDLKDLVLPLLATGGVFIAGYVKWVANKVLTDIELKKLTQDETKLKNWIDDHVQHDVPQAPPQRTTKDWLRFFGWALASILLLNEVDLFFWVGLALITERYWIFTQVICSLLTFGVIVVPVLFAVKVRRAERQS